MNQKTVGIKLDVLKKKMPPRSIALVAIGSSKAGDCVGGDVMGDTHVDLGQLVMLHALLDRLMRDFAEQSGVSCDELTQQVSAFANTEVGDDGEVGR